MRKSKPMGVTQPMLLVITSILLSSGMRAARADEPMLAIRQAGGASSVYAVSEIERIRFENDTLIVVGISGSTGYPAAEIIRIEFLWDFSAIQSPDEAAALLKAVHLFQNQPNPFSPDTRIEFELPQAGAVRLEIYSADGRLIRTLVDKELAAGAHSSHWDGRDAEGHTQAGGIYFYSLAAPGIKESRRMILLR